MYEVDSEVKWVPIVSFHAAAAPPTDKVSGLHQPPWAKWRSRHIYVRVDPSDDTLWVRYERCFSGKDETMLLGHTQFMDWEVFRLHFPHSRHVYQGVNGAAIPASYRDERFWIGPIPRSISDADALAETSERFTCGMRDPGDCYDSNLDTTWAPEWRLRDEPEIKLAWKSIVNRA